MTQVQELSPEVAGGSPRRRTAALTVLLIGMLMDLLDTGIVNVALPPIQQDLDASSAALQWLIAGYSLPFAIGLITGGRLGDLYGRKRVFMIGMGLFVVTSLLCTVAQTGGQLVAFRVAQGLAAALMVPQVIATIQVMYAPHERAKPITAAGAMYAVSSVGGPIVGALLTESDIAGLGWRLIFLVNVPVGVATLVAAHFLLPESRSATANRLDVTGMVLVAIGLLLLLYPLAVGHEEGWPAWTFVSMLLSVPALAVFVAHQRRRAASPLLPMSLFQHRSFTGGMVILLLGFGAVFGFFLTFTVYLQNGLGYSIMRAGVAGIWWGLAAAVFAGLAINVLAQRFGRRVVQAGLVITTLGLVAMLLVVRQQGPDAGAVALALPLVLGGAGMGFSISIVMDFALSDVPVTEAGSASGVLNALQQTGAAIGVSAIGALFFGLLPAEPTPTEWAGESSQAFEQTLLLPVGMMIVAFAASFLLPRLAAHRQAPSATADEPVTSG
ncbi:MFS transporter [Streptomyces sp. 8K308]|uniref:MFS transporter n=1 Tax=Streptomyces sp. 8K308 TaxID=2530388 RepID=UPI001047384B|nr:MFS transporter [Streptomyces sp. 8K308]TDC25352.1 MFS transporter [Streptomyces sp. 8K308]